MCVRALLLRINIAKRDKRLPLLLTNTHGIFHSEPQYPSGNESAAKSKMLQINVTECD